MKYVSLTWSPSEPLSGASVKRTRLAYVPSKNRSWFWYSSACVVPAALPSVVAVSCATRSPFAVGKLMLLLSHRAPGTPGLPTSLRVVQPALPKAGSVGEA